MAAQPLRLKTVMLSIRCSTHPAMAASRRLRSQRRHRGCSAWLASLDLHSRLALQRPFAHSTEPH